MTDRVRITGLSAVRREPRNGSPKTPIAHFNVEVRGFELNGCVLYRDGAGDFGIWPPRLHGAEGAQRFVAIRDAELRKQILIRALEAFDALRRLDEAADDQPVSRREAACPRAARAA